MLTFASAADYKGNGQKIAHSTMTVDRLEPGQERPAQSVGVSHFHKRATPRSQ